MLKTWYQSHTHPSQDIWHTFTKGVFDTFIMHGPASPLSVPSPSDYSPPTKLTYTPNSPTTTPIHESPLYEFNKGIRRSVSDYPKLKDDKCFMSWDRTVQAIARSQDVYEVLDHTYVPMTQHEEQRIRGKSSFM